MMNKYHRPENTNGRKIKDYNFSIVDCFNNDILTTVQNMNPDPFAVAESEGNLSFAEGGNDSSSIHSIQTN